MPLRGDYDFRHSGTIILPDMIGYQERKMLNRSSTGIGVAEDRLLDATGLIRGRASISLSTFRDNFGSPRQDR